MELVFFLILVASIISILLVIIVDEYENLLIGDLKFSNLPINTSLGPNQITYDGDNDRIYVVNNFAESIEVLEARSYSKSIKYPLLISGAKPLGIYHDESNNLLYVTNTNSNNVNVYDDSYFQFKGTFEVGKFPTAVKSYKNKIYVTNFLDDTISVVNSRNISNTNNLSNNITKTLNVGDGPTDLIVVSDLSQGTDADDRIYVLNKNDTFLSIINPNSDLVVKNLALSKNDEIRKPFAFEYTDRNEGKLFVAVNNISGLSVIDTINNYYLVDLMLGFIPKDIEYDSENKKLFVLNNINKTFSKIYSINVTKLSDNLKNNLSIFDSQIDVEMGSEHIVSDNNGLLYISHPFSHKISVVDVNNLKVNSKISHNTDGSNKLLNPVAILVFTLILISLIFTIIFGFSYILLKKILLIKIGKYEGKLDTRSSLVFSLILIPLTLVLFDHLFAEFGIIINELYGGNPPVDIQSLLKVFEGLNYVLYILTILVYLIYPPYPFIFISYFKNYFVIIGEDIAVKEYTYFKKIYILLAFVFMPILSIIIFFPEEIQSFLFTINSNLDGENIIENPIWRKAHTIMLLTFLVISIKFFFLKFYTFRKYRLQLIFAKGWIELANKNKEREVIEIDYIKNCLHTYNRYLQDFLDLQISKLDLIISRISRLPKPVKDNFVNELLDIFINKKIGKNGESLIDKEDLSAARYLYNFLDLPKEIPFLVRKSLFQQTRSIIEVLAIIIPIIISIFQIFTKQGLT